MSPRMRAGESGSLLVMTLWLVTILSVLAVAIARYLSTEVRLTRYRLARAQAGALAHSGVFLAIQRLERDAQPEVNGKTYDWLGDDWAYIPSEHPAEQRTWVVRVQADETDTEQAPEEIDIEINDVERKLNVNQLTLEQLQQIVGVPELAQAILDYYDDQSAGEVYVSDPPYYQKNGPVVALDELLDVPGVTSAVTEQLARVAFAVPGTEPTVKVNINTAPADVLRLLGLSEGTIESILQFRDGPDGSDAHEADGVFDDATRIVSVIEGRVALTDAERTALSNGFDVVSQRFTIISEGRVERPAVQRRVEAVVQRSGDPLKPPMILSWREG